MEDRNSLISKLLLEIIELAQEGHLPDGDGVNIPTLLWAEGWCSILGIEYERESVVAVVEELRNNLGHHFDNIENVVDWVDSIRKGKLPPTKNTRRKKEYPELGRFTVKVIDVGDACGFVIDGMSISAFSDTIGKAMHEFGTVLQLMAEDEEDAMLIIGYDKTKHNSIPRK